MFRQILPSLRFGLSKLSQETLFCGSEGFNSVNASRSAPYVSNFYHTSPALSFMRKLKKEGLNLDQKEQRGEGENDVFVTASAKKSAMFPNANTPNELFNGIMFKDLPIVNIKASPNNTIFSVTDTHGTVKLIRSCGVDGFRNVRKSTNVAAQATGFALGKRMVQKGMKTVRARVQGLGAGRMSSLKGLTLSGVSIISVTDNTPISWHPARARKAKRL